MAKQEHQFTTPVGRMIGGSLYRPKTTDDKGAKLLYKNGPKKGQERQDFNFGVAFPKSAGVGHWASEPWLQAVWNLGHAAFPQGQAQRKDFSWKIIDGDSTEPNKKMKRPCDQEGYPGHWVIWFSSTLAPKATNSDGKQILHEVDAIKPGYYVQVFATVNDNQPSETPGMYWNPHYVALAGYGSEIVGGPDLAAANFGQGVQLPAGASATPIGGIPAPVGAPPPPPGAAPAPMAPPPPPAAAAAAAPAPTAPPPPPPAAPVAPARMMTAAANGWTYEQLIGQGHTDASLVAQGLMLPPAPAAGSVPAPPPAAPTAPVPVHPNPAFTQMIPPAPPAPPVPGRTPTAKAEGRTLEQLLAMPGWTEAALVQNGYLA